MRLMLRRLAAFACLFVALGSRLQVGAAPPGVALARGGPLGADRLREMLQASFIWPNGLVDRPGVAVGFRRAFDLGALPATASLSIFADARYVLWVNGVYVERGPGRFQPNGPEYDVIPVERFLVKGHNLISVLVVGNLSGGKVMLHRPGLTAVLEVGGKTVLATDERWRWTEATRYRSVSASWANLVDARVDCRKEDDAWLRPDGDDSRWAPCTRISGKDWGPLSARNIPLLRERDIAYHLPGSCRLPVSLAEGKALTLTTERIVQAYLEVALDARDGTELVIEPFGVHYTARAGKQTHFTLDSAGLSQATIRVISGSATLTGIRLVERLYPFDCVGEFDSSDGFLNRLWRMCSRSCQVLSEDAYVDCADRERVEWMDNDPPAYEVTRVALAGVVPGEAPAYSDPRLYRELLRRTALTLQPEGWVKAHTSSDRYDIHAKMEDRACDWVCGVRKYYEATGDVALVKEVWPAVVSQLEYFLCRRSPRGLVRGRDWAVWDNPLRYVTGETTALNAFVVSSLHDAAALAGAIEDDARAREFRAAELELKTAINATLWDSRTGGYFSGYFDDHDEHLDNVSTRGPFHVPLPVVDHRTPPTLHSNVFALLSGTVPEERRHQVESAVEQAQRSLSGGQVMIYYYVSRILYSRDTPDADLRVLELLRANWGPMVDSPLDCSWESFSGGSKAHTYGMFPAYLLSTYVLGVRRDAPTASGELVIEPHLGDLSRASGTVSTEFGLVRVAWKKVGDKTLFSVSAPEGVHLRFRLPPATSVLGEAECDGRKIAWVSVAGRREARISGGYHEGWFGAKGGE